MDLKAFKDALAAQAPPRQLDPLLQALWHDAKGDWNRAHELAQAQEDRAGAWVHAYLHRKEGDAANAAYWYRRAGRPVAAEPLEREWEALVEHFLRQAPG